MPPNYSVMPSVPGRARVANPATKVVALTRRPGPASGEFPALPWEEKEEPRTARRDSLRCRDGGGGSMTRFEYDEARAIPR